MHFSSDSAWSDVYQLQQWSSWGSFAHGPQVGLLRAPPREATL